MATIARTAAGGRVRLGTWTVCAVLGLAGAAAAQGPLFPPPVLPVGNDVPVPVPAPAGVAVPPYPLDLPVSTAAPPPAAPAPVPAPGGVDGQGGPGPCPTCPPDAKPAAPKPLHFDAVWNNGLFFQTADKDFVVHVGGVLQFDGTWYTAQRQVQLPPAQGGTGPFNDSVDVRRARIRTEGTMWKSVDWVFEVELAAAGFNPTNDPASIRNTFWTPAPTDMFAQLKDVPYLGTVRVGQQKEPFSLERLNSARLLNFMERSYLADAAEASAFNNNRSPGVSVFRTFADDRVYASVGFFKNVRDLYGYGIGDGEYAVTGRVTGLPVWCPEGKYFLHVGGAMSHRDPVGEQVQSRARPNIRVNPLPFIPLVANTGLLFAESKDLFGLELAGVYQSFTFQAEYQAFVDRNVRLANGTPVGDVLLGGWYAEALYFLTGESRPYNPKAAVFTRVIPNDQLVFENGRLKGKGAVELAARYSLLDLTSDGVTGGRLRAVTLGVNWYWNANTRMQFNYDYLYRDQVSNADASKGIVHSVGTRMQYDF